MVATVLIAAVLVALLVLYISEYARITVQGNFQQDVRGKLQGKYQEIEALQAEVAKLKQTERIVAEVQQRGFVRLMQKDELPVAASLRPGLTKLSNPSSGAGKETPAYGKDVFSGSRAGGGSPDG